MGLCVSVQKDPVKVRLSTGSEDEKFFIPSLVKQKSDRVNGGDRTVADVVLKTPWSPSPFSNSGSKEESFFDSQPWLESDCEDEFLSVNDFTPSLGNTPIHHNFSSATSLVEPSPSDKRKRLSELFKESLCNHNTEEVNTPKSETASLVDPKSTHTTPSGPGAIVNERTPKTQGKLMKSSQCCLPRFGSSRSYMMSPMHNTG